MMKNYQIMRLKVVFPAVRFQLMIFQVLDIVLPWNQQAFLGAEGKKNPAHKPRNSALSFIK